MSKVFAIIDCSIPINTRNQKIIDSLKKFIPGCEVHTITWNREGMALTEDKYFHTFNMVAPYSDVKAKLKGMWGFKKYIGKMLKEINPDVIIASHWSNFVLTSGYKKKGQMLVYENLDIPTGGSLARGVSRFLENRSLKKVDLILYASRFFKDLYPQSIPQYVLENKPAYSPCLKEQGVGDPLKIAFIGSIRYKDILMNLADAVKGNPKFELYFHGSGEDLPVMQEYCKDMKNVFFTGKYDYSTVVSLYHQSDIIWAGYPNKDYNVVYAISNKFHESLYVGVPCVYSDKTMLANYVKAQNIGFVVDPYSVGCIRGLFDDIANGKIVMDGVKKSMIEYQKSETIWDEDFKNILKYFE